MNKAKKRKSKGRRRVRRAVHRAPAMKAYRRRSRSRRRNPVLKLVNRRRRGGVKRAVARLGGRRRSRNPVGGAFMGQLSEAGFLIGGGIGTRSLPVLITGMLGNPGMNAGFVGYGMNLLSAYLLSQLAGRWKGPAAAKAVFMGGVVFTASRVFDDYTGKKLVQFAQLSPTAPYLSGDARYGMALSGVFTDLKFVLPSVTKAMPTAAMPAMPAVAATAAKPALASAF